ncbi:hypothetical protein [Mycolicibacterium nivoides]|uniref:hypothetical protein n=1 Tax=Mycolicibacterium nivoides TaxID=2487344 RepID=UPI0019D0B856|nr:hypothetical protein [Mycolicibacterium nivoides]
MSQADENHLPTEPPPGAPTTPPPLLQPNLNPPPGYLGSAGTQPYPYPYPSPVPAVHVTMYAPPVAAKNPGLAALLAALFGCLGMLYATVPGAFIMFGINVLLFLIGFFTLGMTWFLWLFTWIGGIAWAYMAADTHNKKLLPAPPYYPPSPH